ncbi:hypothetical protein N7527_005793 [Penicillium freii]|nr:hypothetical protein N7527_005793 [Penicillium freii]
MTAFGATSLYHHYSAPAHLGSIVTFSPPPTIPVDFTMAISNINAGSDTTAISLRAILYYTLKNPQASAKLQQELITALEENRVSLPVSWKQS